eukprot:scaffold200529_cov31-Tisochrysis_lutea.AAC.3
MSPNEHQLTASAKQHVARIHTIVRTIFGSEEAFRRKWGAESQRPSESSCTMGGGRTMRQRQSGDSGRLGEQPPTSRCDKEVETLFCIQSAQQVYPCAPAPEASRRTPPSDSGLGHILSARMQQHLAAAFRSYHTPSAWCLAKSAREQPELPESI